MYTVYSFCCTAETNSIVQQIYSNNNKKRTEFISFMTQACFCSSRSHKATNTHSLLMDEKQLIYHITEFSEYSYEIYIYTIVLPFLQVSKLRHRNINSSKAAQLVDGVIAKPLFRFRKLNLYLMLNTATLCTDHISS